MNLLTSMAAKVKKLLIIAFRIQSTVSLLETGLVTV